MAYLHKTQNNQTNLRLAFKVYTKENHILYCCVVLTKSLIDLTVWGC